MKKLLASLLLLVSFSAHADLFLATHLLLNTLAAKFLPDYESTTFHGPYVGITYGYRFELGEAYKLGSDTEGSEKTSPGLALGYQFLQSSSHKLALTYDRKYAKYQTINELEGEDVIDSFGVRFNWGLMAFKFGWASHAFEDQDNKHDAGSYTGIGFDIWAGQWSFYMDLTNYYLEDRKEHITGGDVGLRYNFGNNN